MAGGKTITELSYDELLQEMTKMFAEGGQLKRFLDIVKEMRMRKMKDEVS